MAAVVAADETPFRVMVQASRFGKKHSLFITEDGSVRKTCGGCRDCNQAVRVIFDLAGMPFVDGVKQAAGLFQAGYRPEKERSVGRWHRNCGVDCLGEAWDDAEEEMEMWRWMSVGAVDHVIAEEAVCAGWTRERLQDTGLCNAAQWVNAGFDIDDASRWQDAGWAVPTEPRMWVNAGFGADETVAWITRTGIPEHVATQWVRQFPDPDEAADWYRAWRSVAKKISHDEPKDLRVVKDAGVAPGKLADWYRTVSKEPKGLAYCAEATDGDIGLAAMFARRVGVYKVRGLVQASGSVTEAEQWVDARFTDADVIRQHRDVGWTPRLVTEARQEGTARIEVGCGEDVHQVVVRWKNGRASWDVVDHDQELEDTAVAFGGETPACMQSVRWAQNRWRDGNTVTPGAALQQATGDDQIPGPPVSPIGEPPT